MRKRGMTLIEILVVIGLLISLSAIMANGISAKREVANQEKIKLAYKSVPISLVNALTTVANQINKARSTAYSDLKSQRNSYIKTIQEFSKIIGAKHTGTGKDKDGDRDRIWFEFKFNNSNLALALYLYSEGTFIQYDLYGIDSSKAGWPIKAELIESNSYSLSGLL